MPPTVWVLTTGGTIASTSEGGGATPTKRGKELVEAVPELGEYADLRVEEVFQVGSIAMDPASIVNLGERIQAIADEADGIVILHGTDTMEESAFYLDLTLNLEVPVVLTGAQRRPDEISPDGPMNMLAAVRSAGSDYLRGQGGVYIAFNSELHAARDVTKSHTSKINTFRSPEKGPIAEIVRTGIRTYRQPGSKSITLPLQEATARVEMVKSGIAVDEQQITLAVDAGVDGIVVEGTGLGNTTPNLGNGIQTAIDENIPIVLTSRCYAGAVEPVYGIAGGGKMLHDHGVILGDDFPAHKARIKLMIALEETRDLDELREIFEYAYD